MNLAQETGESELRSRIRLSDNRQLAIAAFPDWAKLFQHLEARHDGVLDVRPCGLIGLQHLWLPERRFDFHRLDELGVAASFTFDNPRQMVFCAGDLVRSLASDLVAAGCCSLTDILEHWVTPVEAQRFSRAVSERSLLLWTSANSQDRPRPMQS